MKLIIEIPDHIYEHAKNRTEDGRDERDAIIAIAKGILYEERPHGEWIEKPWGVVCSRCKAQALHTPNGNQSRSDYCPNCGALMRKER